MARSRSIDYRVGFSGDTSQLEAAIKKATESLTKLGTSPDALRRGLEGASRSALELSQHLNTAFNQDTGKLDLIKFQQSLTASGKSIQDYATSLRSLGPQGEQAFLEVASAIGKAELPLKRTNNLIKQFGVTLWNTARWRITTGAINSIVGGMQQAMGYTKSLDSSLNNIRIVTGKSAAEMAAFAKEANSAAKALSTTTTTYTDASLIYYQQGLDTEAVKERTEATIKMANVTGQSAETISSQMTAIWENFDDGSRSLESFGDAMVALGASTAASSKEIAEGLQKFAPIAQTVGLSFDYASAALTTIVANTRESASVAGTALKTLFSRLEGLKLGETLEDGTDLNKYSSALMAVGINIKDVSGNLKDMDSILDELGAKWQSLAKDQQLALAETVGGVRQYAQLVALMDNWADFQKNLVTAQSSEGALQRQADIYAESWEAARQRVKAATEDIYDSFINADQFVKLDDMFTPLLTGIASAVDALGGLTGMLPLVVMLMNNAFGDKIAQSLRNMTVNIGLMTGAEQKRARALQASFAEAAKMLTIGYEENAIANTKIGLLSREVELQALINSKYEQMPALQKAELANEQEITAILKDQALALSEKVSQMKELAAEAEQGIIASAMVKDGVTNTNLFGNRNITNANAFYSPIFEPGQLDIVNNLEGAVVSLVDKLHKINETAGEIGQLTKALDGTGDAAERAKNRAIELLNAYGKNIGSNESITNIKNALHELSEESLAARNAVKTALDNLSADSKEVGVATSNVAGLASAEADLQIKVDAANSSIDKQIATVNAASSAYMDWADRIVQIGTVASKASMAMRSLSNLGKVFNKDNNMSTSERMSQGLMSIGMLAPLIGTGGRAAWNFAGNRYGLSEKQGAYEAAQKALLKAQRSVPSQLEQDAVYGAYAANRSAIRGANQSYKYWQRHRLDANGSLDQRAAQKSAEAFEKLDKAKKASMETDAAYAAMQTRVAQGQKAVQDATGKVQAAEQAANAARKASIVTMGLYAAAAAAVIVAIVAVVRAIQKQREEQKKLNEERIAAAEQVQEERENNQTLIDDYRQLLAVYKETGEGKDELDAKARDLATAYGIEGAALAALTGNYDNFTKSLNNAIRARLGQDKETLATGAVASLTNNGLFKKYSNVWDTDVIGAVQESPILNKLLEYSQEATVWQLQTAKLEGETTEETLQNVLAYREELLRLSQDSNKAVSDWANNQLSQIGSAIAQIQGLFREIGVVEAELSNPSVQNYQEYKTWADGIERTLLSLNHSATETKSIITEASHNLGFDEWLSIREVANDITDQLRYYPQYLRLAQDKLNNVKSLDEAKILAYVPWSRATENPEQLDDLIAETERYIQTLEAGAKAAIKFADAEKLLQKIQSNSTLKVKDFDDYIELFGSIEKLEEFLKQNPEQRETQLNQIMRDSFLEAQQTRQARIEAIGKELEDLAEGEQGGELALVQEAKNAALEIIEKQAEEANSEIANAGIVGAQPDVTANDIIAGAQDVQTEWANARQSVIDYFTQLGEEEDQQAFKDKNKDLISRWHLEDIDLTTALENIDEQFGAKIDENVAKYIQAGFDEKRLREEKEENQDTISKEQLAYDYETQQQIEQVKTLGELNKLQRTRKLSVEDYNKAITKLAKGIPGASKAQEEYNKALASGVPKQEAENELIEKYRKLVEDDAWGTAFAAIKKVQDELKATGSTLTEQGTLDGEAYKKQLTEVAKALNEVFGGDYWDVEKVQANADKINDILAGEQDALTSIYNTINLAETAASSSMADFLSQFGFSANEITTIAQALDGIDFTIDGYANMEQVIQSLLSVGATASQMAGVLIALSNSSVGFKITGLEGVQEVMAAQGTYGSPAEYEAALLDAISMVSIQGDTTNVPPGYYGGATGGGGGKKNTKDLKKNLEDVEDRYHEINRQLEKQQRAMSELEKQINRTYGTKRLELYKQQLQQINDRIDLLTQKNLEAMENLEKDKQVLLGNTTDDLLNVKLFEGFDIIFGEGGEILNYNRAKEEHEAILKQIVDDYNNFIVEYEQAVKAGKVSEELEEQKEQEDKIYQARLDALAAYENSLDEVNTIYHDITEERRKAEDAKLNEITYKMKLVLDVREAKKQINDFSKTIEESFGDALTHGAKAILFDEQNAKIEMDMYKHYLEEYEALHQRLAEANEFTDTDAIIEELKTLEGNIIESGEALLEWLDTVENMYVEALDAAAERFDWFTNQIAHDTDVLGMIRELYALQNVTYKTQEGFNKLQEAAAGQYQGYLRQAQLNKAWYEEASARLAEAEEALAGVEETDVRYDALKKNRDALLEEANRAQEAILENAKSAMETARQMYLDQIDRMSYELEQRMTNGIGFDLLEEKYNHFLEESDRFLDPVEEGLETAAWYTKLQNDINRTSNNLYKDRLKALQEEIDLRRENNTLSQYDLDLLEAKYQVLQAEMALEDARNNKNQLRLVRDSNGNWNYEYTSNPNDLATREEELLKAKQNEYEITKERYKELNDELLKMAREFAEEDKKIRQDMANGILTEEEGQARLAELQRYYEEKAAYLSSELTIAKNDMSEAAVTSSVLAAGLSESVLATSSDTIQEIVRVLKDEGGPELIAAAGSVFETLQEALKDNLVDKFGETSEEVQQHIKDIIAGENDEGTLEWMTKEFATNMDDIVGVVEDNFLPSIESYIPRAGKAFEDFTDKIEDTANAIGVDPGNLSDMTQELTDNIDNLYYSGMEAVQMMWEQLDNVRDLQYEYLSWADAVMEVVRAMEELARSKVVPDIESAAGVSLGESSSFMSYSGDLSQRMAQAEWNRRHGDENAAAAYADFESQRYTAEEQFGTEVVGATEDVNAAIKNATDDQLERMATGVETINDTLGKYDQDTKESVWDYTDARTKGIVGGYDEFATGGYTGTFDNGKLAMLHEKELVLNEADTRNILEAVHIMRGISDAVFNGIADSLNSAGIASMALLGSHLGGASAAAAGGTLEQHVTIEQVNFPGVTSSREIEEAFESLVNDAAQWARRRKG